MNWLQSVLYGLLSGITEFLPISSEAHQLILQKIFGMERPDSVCELLVHLGVLLALLTCCRTMIHGLSRELNLYRSGRKGRRRATKGVFEFRFVKSASAPLLIGLLLLLVTAELRQSLTAVALFLMVNGMILFLPERMSNGNKDARSMSPLDGFLIGISGALSVFPGISRVGTTASVAVARGAGKQSALNWTLLLSIPALALLMGFDLLHLATYGFEAFSLPRVLGYILTLITSYAGGFLSILFLRFTAVRSGFSGFAYYCWGAALFTFILYLAI